MQPFTLKEAARYLVDEGAAWEALEAMRWPNGPECPHCGEHDRVRYLRPREGTRRTRTGKVTYRRLWKCNNCRKPFTALVGTIFEDSRIPVGKWLMAVCLMASAKNGVSAHELHRVLGITYKTSWFMCHRLRLAMSLSPVAEKWSNGIVAADEAWIGGDPKNWHAFKRRVALESRERTQKTPVITLVNKETGEARSRVAQDISGPTIRKMLADHMDMATMILFTDESRAYALASKEFAVHEMVNHSEGEYARRGVSTNAVEGYFGQLKRSLDGTHHRVSPEHLPRYTGEFDFRYSTRKMADSERALRMVRQGENRRLTYDHLTGRDVRRPLSGRGSPPSVWG